MKKRILSLAMVAVMTTSMLVGCGGKTNDTSSTTGSGPIEPEQFKGVTLTYWCDLNASVASSFTNEAETAWAKEVMKQTGINIEFVHPAVGEADSAFTVLCASGEYPDIIQYTWTKYSGGPDAAIDDGVIISLDDLIQNNSPNLSAVLKENPDVDKMIKTASGHYYVYPFLRGTKNDSSNITLFSNAMIIRKDLLDKTGLGIPETIDDWDKVLRAFKSSGVEVPFCTRSEWMLDAWSGGFDNWGDFYIENGKVKNGLAEDSRKAFLQQMNTWYKDGLIDRDYLVADKKSNQTYFTTEKSAAVFAPIGQGLGTYTQLLNKADSSITEKDVVACPPVTSKNGSNAKFSKVNNVYDGSGSSAAISTSCKNKEAAAYLLDWMYSKEGSLVNNFGVEGTSYTMKDGKPVYTELITNNPDGLTFDVALAQYTQKSGPMIQDPEYINQYYSKSNQQAAFSQMEKSDMLKNIYPTCAAILPEDADRASEIQANIKNYKNEMEAKFIAGDESLDKWDEYVKKLKSIGLDELTQIKQRAYDNYMKN